MNLEKILPSREELAFVELPEGLNYSFTETVQREVAKTAENSDDKENVFDSSKIKDLEGFFESIGDAKPAAAPPSHHPAKKSMTRRSLDNNSSSKRNSITLGLEEFPIALMKDNMNQVNSMTARILDHMDHIRNIDFQNKELHGMIEKLEEAVKRLSEKTENLANRTRNQPNYEDAHAFLSQDTQTYVQTLELLVRNLNAKKSLETKLGENYPDPEATTEDMSCVKQLVSEFINDDKNS